MKGAVKAVPGVADWELAFLPLYAEDAFCAARDAGTDLEHVPPDPRLSRRWTVLGTVTAVDAPFRLGKYKFGARRVFYGWRLKSKKGQVVLAIRGTNDCAECLVDGLFAPRSAHPLAGRVETGFWSVFKSLLIDGKPLSSIADGGSITVVGHSLGAAVATYASLELAKAGTKVRGVFIASPHPGNRKFCKAFGEAVPDHVMYRNAADYVTRVPFWFGYSSVPNVKTLSAKEAGIKISGGPVAQHHVISYCALMSRKAIASFKPLSIDLRFLDRIQF